MTRLTMLLAQGPGKPDGDLEDRLVMGLCLTQQGQIDVEAYNTAPHPWLARRERAGQSAARPRGRPHRRGLGAAEHAQRGRPDLDF